VARLFSGLAVLVAALPLDIHHQGVAVAGDTLFDRFESRRPLAHLLERLVHRGIVHTDGSTPHVDRAELSGIERRQHVEFGLEGERLAFFELHVADVRRVHRLDAALREGFFDGVLDEVMRDVVHDLALETLAHDPGRHFARTKPGQPRLSAIPRSHARNFGVDDLGRNLDHQVLAGFVHINQFGLHRRRHSRLQGFTGITQTLFWAAVIIAYSPFPGSHTCASTTAGRS
jgi:hypothetical protein